ncbi:surfeit locus protein 5 [Iris pallida]|uniref:Surfeit locus protein 5 n=1 Tax=Iris pallida TaxID=29817 RepID=A0AAX6F382_IRIPA|nr:surfeit locus protein 5 [Iris pallida]
MSKPGATASGAGIGPTAAVASMALQKQKALLQRVDTEVANVVDYFTQIVNISRVTDPPVRNTQDSYQMDVRAAKLTQSAEALLKLVSDLKQTAIFSGFASLNENVDRRIQVLNREADATERLLERIGEQAAAGLKELETHYYSSVLRNQDG